MPGSPPPNGAVVGDVAARFPRRRRALVPLRWYHGTFTLDRPAAADPGRPRPAAAVGAAGPGPALPARARSGRSRCSMTPGGCGSMSPPRSRSPATRPGRSRIRPGSRGSIWASSTRTRWPGRAARGCWCRGGRSAPSTGCTWPTPRPARRAVARRAPKPGQKGSRRWRHYRRRQRLAEARHRRRVRQAQHEAAKAVIAWAVDRRVGTLAVGDPRGVLKLKAGRRHNQRTRDWRIGHLITVLERQGRGRRDQPAPWWTSAAPPPPARPAQSRVPKPPGRVLACPACQFTGHRDLVRGRQHRRQTRRRDHAGHPGRRHAPPRRGAPARCRPLAT